MIISFIVSEVDSEELVNVYSFHRFETLCNRVSKKTDPRRLPHELKTMNTLSLLFSAVTGDLASLHR